MPIRVTGINGAFFGITWEYFEPEKKALQTLIDELADRRLLYDENCGDRRTEMRESLEEVREATTRCKTEITDVPLRRMLHVVIRECHEFQTKLEKGADQIELSHKWLGEFRRGVLGVLAPLVKAMKVDAPDDFERALDRVYALGETDDD